MPTVLFVQSASCGERRLNSAAPCDGLRWIRAPVVVWMRTCRFAVPRPLPRPPAALAALVLATLLLAGCRTTARPDAARPDAARPADARAAVAPPTVPPAVPPRSPSDPPIASLRLAATALPVAPFSRAEVEAGVRAVLDAQVTAWNEGSVRGFMDGYAESDSLVFLSGATVRRGWEEALYGYLRTYPDAAAMGLLSFDEVAVVPLSGIHAVAWGRWRLRVDGPLEEGPGGLFTLVFVRTDQGWRIVHDHTS